jgi:hypothetical protein
MSDLPETKETYKSSEEGTSNNASITIHGVDGATLNLILAKIGASVALVAVASTTVFLSCLFLSMFVWRESDRIYTQEQLTRLKLDEVSIVLVKAGLKKQGDDWHGPMLNEILKMKPKEDK